MKNKPLSSLFSSSQEEKSKLHLNEKAAKDQKIAVNEKNLKAAQKKKDIAALSAFKCAFKVKGTIVGHTYFDRFFSDYNNRNYIPEPVIATSFISLRLIGEVPKKTSQMKGWEIGYIPEDYYEDPLAVFEPVIKCLGCGNWAMLCNLSEPSHPCDSYSPQALRVQTLDGLTPVLEQFDDALKIEPLNCQTWGTLGTTGLTAVCPTVLEKLHLDTLQKKKKFPDLHQDCQRFKTKYGGGCDHGQDIELHTLLEELSNSLPGDNSGNYL